MVLAQAHARAEMGSRVRQLSEPKKTKSVEEKKKKKGNFKQNSGHRLGMDGDGRGHEGFSFMEKNRLLTLATGPPIKPTTSNL